MERFPVGPGRWRWSISPDEIAPPKPAPVLPIDIDARNRWYIDAKGSIKAVDPTKGIPSDARKWTFEGAKKWFHFHGEQLPSARRSMTTHTPEVRAS